MVYSSLQLEWSQIFKFVCFFPGGSLADLIERNKKSNEVMGEAELKQLLIQVAQVIWSFNCLPTQPIIFIFSAGELPRVLKTSQKVQRAKRKFNHKTKVSSFVFLIPLCIETPTSPAWLRGRFGYIKKYRTIFNCFYFILHAGFEVHPFARLGSHGY